MASSNNYIHKSYVFYSYLKSNKSTMIYIVFLSSTFGLLGCSNNSPPIDKTKATLSQAYGIWYALHAYKEKHGQFPEKLEMLVPEFLPSLDPPYSSPKRGWIYYPSRDDKIKNNKESFFLGFNITDTGELYNYGFSSEQIEPEKGAMIAPSG